MHLHGLPRPRLRRLCLLFHHRPVWGRPPDLPRHSAGTNRVRCWLHQGGVAQRRVSGGIARIQDAIEPPCCDQMLRIAAVVGSEGVAPSHPYGHQLLGLARLLFRHEPSWCPRLVLPQRPPACRAGALLAQLRGHRPPRQDSHLRPPASKAGALSAELLGVGRACRTRTGVWLRERELSLAARRTPHPAPRRSSALRPRRYELRVPLSTPARSVVTRAGSAPAASPV